jgi:hypothetical protein
MLSAGAWETCADILDWNRNFTCFWGFFSEERVQEYHYAFSAFASLVCIGQCIAMRYSGDGPEFRTRRADRQSD